MKKEERSGAQALVDSLAKAGITADSAATARQKPHMRTMTREERKAETDARNARRARRAAKGRQPTTENAEEKKP